MSRSASNPDYKKKFRAPAIPGDCLQLLAAARVVVIFMHFTFSRDKNLSIFVFKIWFEISPLVVTHYVTDAYATRNQKTERKSVSADGGITYPDKNLTPCYIIEEGAFGTNGQLMIDK